MQSLKQYSEHDINRIRDFVDHLISNPGIKNEPPIIGERLIVNFIAKNISQLKLTFKNPEFFPSLEWNDVLALLFEDTYNRTAAAVLPMINVFIDNSDLSFFDRLSESGVVADMHRKVKLHEFILMNFKNRDVRFNMTPAVNILKYDVIDRYVSEIFRRRDYIHNEIVRVQKINLEAGDYIKLLKVMLLIRSVVHMKLNLNRESAGDGITLADVVMNKKSIKSYMDAAAISVAQLLPGIPVRIINLSLKSNLAADLTGDDEAVPKMLYILCSMFQNYRHIEKIDRGAESQDKSWLASARKNYSHFGYDRRILDSLYMIAGDNNW